MGLVRRTQVGLGWPSDAPLDSVMMGAHHLKVERSSLQAVFRALNGSGLPYLVAGGLAVVAHGFLRFTADVDIILDLRSEKLRSGLQALGRLGFRPRAPVDLLDFADGTKRRQWVETKGLTVFSLFSPEHPTVEIDLFVEDPLDVEESLKRALHEEIAKGIPVLFLGREDLIRVKQEAGRPQDLADIQALQELQEGEHE